MPVRKVYQSLHFKDFDTYVLVKGKKEKIQFRGGSMKPPINGKYSTEDPAVIAAMDKDSGNGTSFRCISVEGEEEKTKVSAPAKSVNPASSGNDETKEDTTVKSDNGVKSVPEVKNIQEARDYLVKNVQGMTASKLPNETAIKNAAAKHNIEFPNLNVDVKDSSQG